MCLTVEIFTSTSVSHDSNPKASVASLPHGSHGTVTGAPKVTVADRIVDSVVGQEHSIAIHLVKLDRVEGNPCDGGDAQLSAIMNNEHAFVAAQPNSVME